MKYLCIVIFIFSSLPLFSQTLTNFEQELLIQNGIAAFNERKFDLALTNFTIVKNSTQLANPKVDFWIGRVFESEGEFALAEQQFITAIDGSRIWEQKELEVTVIYHLADFYYAQERYSEFVENLESIIYLEEQPSTESMVLERSIINNLNVRGLNATLVLLRKPLTFSLQAYTLLGKYYTEEIYRIQQEMANGELTDEKQQQLDATLKSALRNTSIATTAYLSSLLAIQREIDSDFVLASNLEELWEQNPEFVIDTLTNKGKELNIYLNLESIRTTLNTQEEFPRIEQALAILQARDPNFDIQGLDYLFYNIRKLQTLDDYTTQSGLMELLYNLGLTLRNYNQSASAIEIWQLIVRNDRGNLWAQRSLVQLEKEI